MGKLNDRIACLSRYCMVALAMSGLLLVSGQSAAQQKSNSNDSIALKRTLSEVIVHVYEQDNPLQDQPGAVSYISAKQFNRYNNTNIVSAMNAVPGVRMELRSPGSVRLNIRGSTLRSPFGVRNVKVYYNGIPFTDPGGNTYLNQLRFADLGSIEIIKGPAGSMYGAGTGGVVLIRSDLYQQQSTKNDFIQGNAGGGSFGLLKGGLKVRWGNKKSKNEVRYADVKQDGYRDHTRLKHRIAAYETRVQLNNKESLNAFFHYSDLYYQTPGALTKAQFEANPQAARPASGSFPSSEENKAAVHQKAFLVGLTHSYHFTKALKNTTALYGAYTDFTNPTVRNYELRKEPHFGGRTVFEYRHPGKKINSSYWAGAEFQQGYFSQQDYQNNKGLPDSLMNNYRINEQTALLFGQAKFQLYNGWSLDAGFSLNHRKIDFSQSFPAPAVSLQKKSKWEMMPHLSLAKKVRPDFLVYIDVSRGFSPPAVSELLPSTNQINKNLEAERGIQYEAGGRGYLFKHRLHFDADIFLFQLRQSISLRRDSSGADYFVNAGAVDKKGSEIALHYILFRNKNTFFSNMNLWNSLTLFHFKYKDYSAGGKDYSGNKMPGSPSFTDAAGMDIDTRIGLTAHITWQHTAKIPLNNANTVYSGAYDLAGCQLSYKKKLGDKIMLNIAIGGDNLLNEKYSLGDDINAFGGRYYNVAPPANFYSNIGIRYNF